MDKRLREIDTLVREGKGREARSLLRAISLRQIQRPQRAVLAALAKRSGLPMRGLRILSPIVRSPRSAGATPIEIAEYAECLNRIGGSVEALELLSPLSSDDYPKIDLYRAFAHIARWEYADAIPILQRYLCRPLSDYEHRIASVNLASALLFVRRIDEGLACLEKVLQTPSGSPLLYGNALQLAGAAHALSGEFDEARRLLVRAGEALAAHGGLWEFFVRKWLAITALLENPRAHVQLGLRQIRKEAQGLQHWETLRDCDRFEAVATANTKLAQYVYFGTPYPFFRSLLIREFPGPLAVANPYVWRMGGRGGAPMKTLSLAGGQVGETRVFRRNSVGHRLVKALASDFYRPLRIAEIHRYVFPNERFNADLSARRVREQVRILRGTCSDFCIPLRIENQRTSYRLTSSAPFALVVGETGEIDRPYQDEIDRLAGRFANREFSSLEAKAYLRVSERTVRRILQRAVQTGNAVRIRLGRHPRFSFVVQQNSSRRTA